MRWRLALPVLLLLLVSTAWGAALEGSCDVVVEATSTLHDFTARGSCQPFTVSLGEALEAAEVAGGEGVRVAVASLDTDNRKRDRQMREMFDADRFPYIRGTLPPMAPRELAARLRAGGEEGAEFPFDLTIRDTTRRIMARAVDFRETDDELTFELRFPVSLEAYGLEPPTVLFLIRVYDRVEVRVPLRLRKSPAGFQLSGQ